MNQPDHVKLVLDTLSDELSFTLSGRKVGTKRGKAATKELPVDKATSKVIFKLAEIVFLREDKSAEYMGDPVFKEAAEVVISFNGKKKTFKFLPMGQMMPDYLRVLVREMSGLTKW